MTDPDIVWLPMAPPDDPAPARPKIVNVSSQFADLNPEDAIYETDEGYLVKVKTIWDDTPVEPDPMLAVGSQHGAERFLVTGSIVGADGKALRRDDGRHAVHDLKRSHVHNADRLEDPSVGLEFARLKCVEDTVRAEKHYQMLRGGYAPALGRLTAFRARKAAEAGQAGRA